MFGVGFWCLGGSLLPCMMVLDGEVENRAKEGFLVASHDEAVKEEVDLARYRLRCRVEAVNAVNHSKDEAT